MTEGLTPLQKTPANIEIDLKQSQVRITWADGYHSIYSLDYLRQICPCASCNELRRNDNPLRVFKSSVATRGELRREHPVEKVGNYALQFFWADGHNTGIYTFGFLRQASPAQE